MIAVSHENSTCVVRQHELNANHESCVTHRAVTCHVRRIARHRLVSHISCVFFSHIVFDSLASRLIHDTLCILPTGVCEKTLLFARDYALQSSNRNCSPPTDLVFFKLTLPRVLLSRGVFFQRLRYGRQPAGRPDRLACLAAWPHGRLSLSSLVMLLI